MKAEKPKRSWPKPKADVSHRSRESHRTYQTHVHEMPMRSSLNLADPINDVPGDLHRYYGDDIPVSS